MAVSFETINDAIAADLDANVAELTFIQSYNELTEGMNDTPTAQIYWESLFQSSGTTTTQKTFGSSVNVQEVEITFHIDVYPRPRSHLDEDFAALLPLATAIHERLQAVVAAGPDYFATGVKAIRSIEARRVIFEYDDSNLKHMGIRFTLILQVV